MYLHTNKPKFKRRKKTVMTKENLMTSNTHRVNPALLLLHAIVWLNKMQKQINHKYNKSIKVKKNVRKPKESPLNELYFKLC